MKYELSEQQVKNLSIFLNRVKYQGLVEAAAALEIAEALNRPLINALKKDKEDK